MSLMCGDRVSDPVHEAVDKKCDQPQEGVEESVRTDGNGEEGEDDAFADINVEDPEHKSRRPEYACHAAKAAVVPELLPLKDRTRATEHNSALCRATIHRGRTYQPMSRSHSWPDCSLPGFIRQHPHVIVADFDVAARYRDFARLPA